MPVQRKKTTLPLVVLVLVLVAAPALTPAARAQERGPAPSAEAPKAEPSPAKPEGTAPAPKVRLGEVVGTVLNVRSGPGIAYGVLTKVLRGTRLTILGERDGWLKVEMPENDYSWVSAQFVEKGSAGVGTVTGDGVNVRVEPDTSAEVLGQLNRGYQVRIVEEREGWVRIKPLPGAIGWVSADFVKELPAEAAPAGPTIPAEEARKKFTALEARFKAEVAKDISEWDLKKFIPEYQALARGAEDRDIRFMAENRLSQLAAFQAVQDRVAQQKKAYAELQDKLKDLEARYQRQLAQLRRATQQPRYIATGVLKRLAISFLPPATHKIEGPDRILFLLYSTDVDLSAYEGKRVGLIGSMTVPKGWETPLIRVTKVDVLPQ